VVSQVISMELLILVVLFQSLLVALARPQSDKSSKS
jgi:hypothetical protein